MMKKLLKNTSLALSLLSLLSVNAGAATKKSSQLKADPVNAEKIAGKAKNKPLVSDKEIEQTKKVLLPVFMKGIGGQKELEALNKQIQGMGGKSVPALIEVMKNGNYPDKSRWVATFMLGRVMGKRSAPFISKFMRHPSWVMRLASLKVLLALKQHDFADLYVQGLKDGSFIVRHQALNNIRDLKLYHTAPHVWAMLYDKRNYYESKKATKRTNIIKEVIATIGELKFQKAKDPLLKMVQKEKYNDIFNEIDLSLEKITGQDSPKGDKKVKRHYWARYGVGSATI